MNDFNLKPNQPAERKLLVTAVQLGHSRDTDMNLLRAGDDAADEMLLQSGWVVIGAGIEDSSIELNPDIETVTDILGMTTTQVNKFEPSQQMEPFTIRGGNPLAFVLNDIVERGAKSELSRFNVMIIRAYLNSGTEQNPKYHAEVHKNCTITPESMGGSSYVDMPITISYSNDKVIGTVNEYRFRYSQDINFVPTIDRGQSIAEYDVSENQDESIIAKLYADGFMEITGQGEMEDYDNKINRPLWRNDENALMISQVVIGEGVTTVGANAFYNCANLTRVTLPDSLLAIDEKAFGYTALGNLGKFYIPAGVEAIYPHAFAYAAETAGSLIIFCGADEQPSTWYDGWDVFDGAVSEPTKYTVRWGYTRREYETDMAME